MSKRTQLNINIDENFLKSLKIYALKKDLKLNELVKQILSEKINKDKESILIKDFDRFSEKDAMNCTNFLKAIFYKKFEKSNYKNEIEAFNSLLKSINKFKIIDISISERLKEIIFCKNGKPLTANELNNLIKNGQGECPIYNGVKDWTQCKEFPSNDLICDLGGSLIPLIEKNL